MKNVDEESAADSPLCCMGGRMPRVLSSTQPIISFRPNQPNPFITCPSPSWMSVSPHCSLLFSLPLLLDGLHMLALCLMQLGWRIKKKKRAVSENELLQIFFFSQEAWDGKASGVFVRKPPCESDSLFLFPLTFVCLYFLYIIYFCFSFPFWFCMLVSASFALSSLV